MPVQLPTDTSYLRLETRQYELFGRPLGQGIARRKLAAGGVFAILWSLALLVIGVDPLTRLGPMLYIGPIAGFVVLGTRTDDSGRMRLVAWYDRVLARTPGRSRVLGNPLLDIGRVRAAVIAMDVMAELHPDRLTQPAVPLLSRAGRRLLRSEKAIVSQQDQQRPSAVRT
ncbi:hypothetical protein [Alloactinosynnema sp. L-07]|uniref:hypothetical protein n=1 Tax=Alloactinosynnema sp. L-07 TaxID=1653480 RepID=UPI00065F0245|nr:hypothetical protein [Alloactinosynnema sp. L-07]CRK59295.1 hypothetical protein [Alloactinosynnema sp. L-07]